jgi:hypothetical protein
VACEATVGQRDCVTVFGEDYDTASTAPVAACKARKRITDQLWWYMSIGLRKWAHNGQSL